MDEYSDRLLGHHGQQLEKLEKSLERIAGLENAITRLDGSVARLTNLERTLPDLAGSIRENLALSRAMEQRLASIDMLRDELRQVAVFAPPTRRLRLRLDSSHMKRRAQPKQLTFEWELSQDQSKGIVAGTKALTLLPEGDPVFRNKGVRTATEIGLRDGQAVIKVSIEFPTIEGADEARKRLADHPPEAEVIVAVGPWRWETVP